jgi:hypothetical protein
MEIVVRRTRTLTALREIPMSALFGGPFPLRRCDALGCDSVATNHCSSHGVHFCRKHFEEHRDEWHVTSWERTTAVARC